MKGKGSKTSTAHPSMFKPKLFTDIHAPVEEFTVPISECDVRVGEIYAMGPYTDPATSWGTRSDTIRFKVLKPSEGYEDAKAKGYGEIEYEVKYLDKQEMYPDGDGYMPAGQIGYEHFATEEKIVIIPSGLTRELLA